MMIAHQYLDHLAEQDESLGQQYRAMFGDAVHFDCGDRGELPRGKIVGGDMLSARAPFPKTLLQFTHDDVQSHSHVLIWFHELDEQRSQFVAAMKERATGKWTGMGMRLVVAQEDGTHKFARVGHPGHDVESDLTMPLFCLAKNFFYVLGCSNVTTVDVPAPEPLNKKRAKKGAAPILTYKTLHLVVPTENGPRANLGGTHSSPRVHLRRGHVRQIQAGRRVWVQACVVGAKHGVVHKDYAIGYGVAA
jgi:hypothetical protein